MHIIYSITNRTYSAVRGVLLLALGLALLFWPVSMLNVIVKIIAAFLVAAGLITFLFAFNAKNEQEKQGEQDGNHLFSTLVITNVIVYILFGLLIFIFPTFFVSILVFLFGAILLLLGVGQLINLFLSSRHSSLPIFFYVVPVIITICGVILFFQPFTAKNVLTMFFGGCLAAYGIIELVSAWMLRKVKFTRDGKYVEVQNVPFEEVKSEKVDEARPE